MNTDTGETFRNLTGDQLELLLKQSPTVVEVSEEVADAVEIGLEVQSLHKKWAEEKRAFLERKHGIRS